MDFYFLQSVQVNFTIGVKNINDNDHLKLVNKVQEQAANDGINVTDSVAGGAVKKELIYRSKNGSLFKLV